MLAGKVTVIYKTLENFHPPRALVAQGVPIFLHTKIVGVRRDHALIRLATRDFALIKTGPQWPVFLCFIAKNLAAAGHAVQTVTKFPRNDGRPG